MRNIIITLGRILLFMLLASLTFISVFISILNPFYYIRVFKNINKKTSRLMNAFFPVILKDDGADNIGGYFSLVVVFAGMIMLLVSLKSC